jgi:hypothetical protein
MLHDEIVALGSDSLQEYLDYMASWPEFDKDVHLYETSIFHV